jgi:hypothetical protein
MARLIRAAGLRWPAGEDFEFGKDCFGLDQSQVRLGHPRDQAPAHGPVHQAPPARPRQPLA